MTPAEEYQSLLGRLQAMSDEEIESDQAEQIRERMDALWPAYLAATRPTGEDASCLLLNPTT